MNFPTLSARQAAPAKEPQPPLLTMLLASFLAIFAVSVVPASEPAQWSLSYDAGYRDDNGAYAGGSEIMHIVSHQGKLYAANGY